MAATADHLAGVRDHRGFADFEFADPPPLPDWTAGFASGAGLARRHNVVALLSALYLLANGQDDVATRARLLPGWRAA